MVTKLKDAFEQASKLPIEAQEQLADQLIDDLDAEAKWDKALADSQDSLDAMAEKAIRERKQGKTRPGGFGPL